MTNKRKRLTALGLIAVLALSVVGCNGEETEESTAVSVEAENPTFGELSSDTTYIGTVEPQEQVSVYPMVSGTVTAVYYEVGDEVQAGDVLFTIDDEAYQLQMESAQAAYDYAAAGVVAATGGSRDLTNYQTEQSIQTIQDSLNDSYETIDDLEDTLDEVRDTISYLTSAQTAAQATVNTLIGEIAVKQAEIDAMLATNPYADTSTADAELAALKSELTVTQTQLSTITANLTSAQTTKTTLKSSIESAESSQDSLKDSLTQAQESYSITQNEIYPETDATYEAQLAQAAVAIDSAQLYLDYCSVTAPISGTVETVNVQTNNLATSSIASYVISNKDSMAVTFSVTESAKNTLQIGDVVTVERNGAEFSGVITEIGTMANSSTKLFQVKATVTDAGDDLPSGVSVKVYATTERAEDQLIIPYDALYFSAGDAYVYCVEDGVIVKTAVTVGLMTDTEAVIEEGLTQDSVVVSTWSSKLRDGVEVQIVTLNGEAVAEEETEEADTEEVVTEEAE